MQRRFADWPPRRRGSLRLALVAVLVSGCVTAPESGLGERRTELATRIAAMGLGDDPEVDAARERLDAAIAAEPSAVALDGVEIRASVTHDQRNTVRTLIRLPIANPLEVIAQREANRAEAELAFAQLEEVTLAQRVSFCGLSVKHLALEEWKRIYESYALRYRVLLDWSEELRGAGLIDEVSVSRFELASRMRLTTRDPSSIPSPLALIGFDQVLDVLPEPVSGARLLRADREFLRERLLHHQPTVGVHRASRKRLEALAESESARRLPSVRFIDAGFEPYVEPGETRSWTARVAVEVPFGRAAIAKRAHYEALARAELSEERGLVERRLEEAWFAIEEINAFRRDGARWLELTALANHAQEVADRWWRDRLTDPGEIAKLLDTIYSARLAVVDARERAGLADCAVTAATGLSASESY